MHDAGVASGSATPLDQVPIDAMVSPFQAEPQDRYEVFNAHVGFSTFDHANSAQMQSL